MLVCPDPGPELPTSQAYLRQQALDWQQRGCPVEVDNTAIEVLSGAEVQLKFTQSLDKKILKLR